MIPCSTILKDDCQAVLSADLRWEKLSGNVLVTGAGGMLASALIDALLALPDVTVYGLVRQTKTLFKRFPHWRQNSRFCVIQQNVCQPVTSQASFNWIIHAASPASPKVYGHHPVDVITPNTIGTQHLLQRAQCDRAKLVFISSAEVYGPVPVDRNPVTEGEFAPIDPTSARACYAESKRLGESLCMAWHRQYGVPVTLLRPFHTYGPGLRLDDGRVFADFVADIVANQHIQLQSAGDARRSFCYVSDAVRGMFTAMLAGSPGKAYNIGNDMPPVSIRELADILVALFPEKNLHVEQTDQQHQHTPGYVSGAVSHSTPDLSRIRALGWQPQVSLADGFRRTILALESRTLEHSSSPQPV